jgi:hypothetical protein
MLFSIGLHPPYMIVTQHTANDNNNLRIGIFTLSKINKISNRFDRTARGGIRQRTPL